jgi:hypothetical protein
MATGIVASITGSGPFTFTAPANCKMIVTGNAAYVLNGVTFAAVANGSRQDIFYVGAGQTLYFTSVAGNVFSVLEE